MSSNMLFKELNRYEIGIWAEIIRRHSILTPEDPAFKYKAEEINYAQYNARINRLVHALRKPGLKKGNVMGLLSRNCLDYVCIIEAALNGGFNLSPFSARFSLSELDFCKNHLSHYKAPKSLEFMPVLPKNV